MRAAWHASAAFRENTIAFRPADLASLEVVMGQLAERMRIGAVSRASAMRMQPQRRLFDRPVVERLADERVPERETVDLLVVLDDQARRDRLLERGDQLVLLLLPIDRQERAEPEVGPQRRCERQRLERLGR